jgi:hypothetical protein
MKGDIAIQIQYGLDAFFFQLISFFCNVAVVKSQVFNKYKMEKKG